MKPMLIEKANHDTNAPAVPPETDRIAAATVIKMQSDDLPNKKKTKKKKNTKQVNKSDTYM
jgi:hypothetical protein